MFKSLKRLLFGDACWGAAIVRQHVLKCIEDHQNWEENYARYDQKIGLVACYRVDRALSKIPLASSALEEAQAIQSLLRTLMSRNDLLHGDYSSEAASIGSILARFTNSLGEVSAEWVRGMRSRIGSPH
jgi:hypothetical protein